MASYPPFSRPSFMTPLPREDLFDLGQVFPRPELLPRVLTFFWRDCCHPACFSRAPAPVIELDPDASDDKGVPRRLRAWWLLREGIVEEPEGPNSDRLKPFYESAAPFGRRRPLYEFRLRERPLVVEMSFHHELWSGRGHRTRLELLADGQLKVAGDEPWWGKSGAGLPPVS